MVVAKEAYNNLRQIAGNGAEDVGGATGTLFSGSKTRNFKSPLRLQYGIKGLKSSSVVQASSFPEYGGGGL